MVKGALRAALEEYRSRLGAGTLGHPPEIERLLAEARARLETGARPSLRRVLNGTGVVLHTNLGRAPLPTAAVEETARLAAGYSNLEFDLEDGERGSRYGHCVDVLRELTGAEDALVVNNNAAAVALAVNALSRGREVIVSRGEMVEIGGAFRIPEVIERAGGEVRGVGTTNRTRLDDYREAIGDRTGILLRVHPSNYAVHGFTEGVGLEELVGLAREHGVPLVHDLGSGLLMPELLEGFPPEPSPGSSVQAGVDLVTWSGDKLLGGPQAGVIVGRGEVVALLRSNPLLRAFRVDKGTLGGLEATLRIYRDPARAADRIPALARLTEPREKVEERARRGLEAAGLSGDDAVRVAPMSAVVGGGSFPEHEIPSAGWEVAGLSSVSVDEACRRGDPPLVGRIEDGRFLVDVRTLLPGEEGEAAGVLARALVDVRSGRDS